jgi:competence ComEA-like helix-hairpin-helix protein
MLYSRPQLRILLVVATIFLAGLGVKQWRERFPETARWLDRFDREESAEAPPVSPELPLTASHKPTSTDGGPARDVTGVESERSPGPDEGPVDINRASAAELAQLPGVGPALAQRILDERQRRGPFESLEALRRVAGIGPKKLAALRDLVTTGE